MENDNFYKKRAWQRLAAIAILIIVAAFGFWYCSRPGSFKKIAAVETSVQHVATQALEKSNTFSAPTPLVGGAGTTSTPSAAPDGNYTLTREGVISQTNMQRAENGNLPPLAENTTLDYIASLRLADMFAKQYFAHISPSSSSALTVASSVGYAHIALGENLALGDFDGDQGVVTAWMNSPGHRANILDTHYTQIGVAVGEGTFQGQKNDWIAVQVFGRPASDCPAPSASAKADIEAGQAQASSTESQLEVMQTQINNTQPQSGAAYDQMAENYNALLGQYNTLITNLKAEIDQYNGAVVAYNNCIAD